MIVWKILEVLPRDSPTTTITKNTDNLSCLPSVIMVLYLNRKAGDETVQT